MQWHLKRSGITVSSIIQHQNQCHNLGVTSLDIFVLSNDVSTVQKINTWCMAPTSPFALSWCWGTMTFMIILSIEWPSVIAKWKVFAMRHLFFPWLFLSLLCFCLLFPLTSFLVMDTIPYIIVGTCSMSIHANLMFCCCQPSFLPPFFTYRKPITPFKEQRS